MHCSAENSPPLIGCFLSGISLPLLLVFFICQQAYYNSSDVKNGDFFIDVARLVGGLELHTSA